MTFWLAFLSAAELALVLPHARLATYLVAVNSVAFAAFCWDKSQAQRDGFRLSELLLHGLTLGAGVAGAALGRWLARHKTRKPQFTASTLGGMLTLAACALVP